MVAAYALSPIDLIPDFIPVLGYLDDLLIVPLGIALAIRLIPQPLLSEFRYDAASLAARPVSKWAAAIFKLLWLLAATTIGLTDGHHALNYSRSSATIAPRCRALSLGVSCSSMISSAALAEYLTERL